jgi:hypothetical protein
MDKDHEGEENRFSILEWLHLWTVGNLTTKSLCRCISETFPFYQSQTSSAVRVMNV